MTNDVAMETCEGFPLRDPGEDSISFTIDLGTIDPQLGNGEPVTVDWDGLTDGGGSLGLHVGDVAAGTTAASREVHEWEQTAWTNLWVRGSSDGRLSTNLTTAAALLSMSAGQKYHNAARFDILRAVAYAVLHAVEDDGVVCARGAGTSAYPRRVDAAAEIFQSSLPLSSTPGTLIALGGMRSFSPDVVLAVGAAVATLAISGVGVHFRDAGDAAGLEYYLCMGAAPL